MKDIRLWSVVLSLTWFLVGLSAGALVSGQEKDPSPFASYADWLTAEFDLDSVRRKGLIQTLDGYERERLDIRLRHEAAFRESMEPELLELHRATDDFIRNQIISRKYRKRFDARQKPLPFTVD